MQSGLHRATLLHEKSRVPTRTGKPGKMGRHFPVRGKSGNFDQTGKVREFCQSGKVGTLKVKMVVGGCCFEIPKYYKTIVKVLTSHFQLVNYCHWVQACVTRTGDKKAAEMYSTTMLYSFNYLYIFTVSKAVLTNVVFVVRMAETVCTTYLTVG